MRDIKQVHENESVYQNKVDRLEDTMIYHSSVIRELNQKVEHLEKANMNPNIIIKGLVPTMTAERSRENCIEVVKSFLTSQMGITQEIPIRKAFRIGKGKACTMLVMLKNPMDKGKIFSNVKKLQDLKNAKGKLYKVEEQ